MYIETAVAAPARQSIKVSPIWPALSIRDVMTPGVRQIDRDALWCQEDSRVQLLHTWYPVCDIHDCT